MTYCCKCDEKTKDPYETVCQVCELVTCPECKGSRLVMAVGPWDTGGYAHCQLCQGEGKLTRANIAQSPEQWMVDTFGEDGLQ